MAFELTIHDDWDAVAVRHRNAYLIVVNFGRDVHENAIYSIAVGLDPLPGGGMEFHFTVLKANNRDNSETPYHSGADTRNFISSHEHRKAILLAVLHATKSLLNQVNPKSVTWFTWDQNAPEKALIKYYLVADTFEKCGYSVQKSDPYNGRIVWWAESKSK